MLTAADLALCQTTTGTTQTTPCQVLRATLVADGWGGETTSWAVVSPAGLCCRVSPFGRRFEEEHVQEERVTVTNHYRIALPTGTDVNERDRISALGATYEVASVQAPRTVELERVVYAWEVS